MKILVVGTGQLAQFRVSALRQDPRVTWIGVASATNERGAAVAADLGADAGGSLDMMLDRAVDGLVVASVTSQHAEHILRCLPMKVPILCEKPIAPSIADSVAVATAAERAGVTIQIGFQRRFDPGLRQAYERIQRGDLGSLYSVRLTSLDHRPPPERYIPTRGSVYRDLHVHDFDLARWITGEEVEWVFAHGEFRTSYDYLARLNDPDVTAMMLRSTSGVTVSISGAQHNAIGHDVRTEIFGSRDNLAIGFDERLALHRFPEGPVHVPIKTYDGFLDRFHDAFLAETSHFLDMLAGRVGNPCPAAAAIEALRIAAAAELSAERGVPVAVTGNRELDAL